ncbi:GGDEF domain-containing protein [Actinoplanes teichomyceticus]|nr:GGDEF domain-containing protein [Actinoplanes teichomyceticus]
MVQRRRPAAVAATLLVALHLLTVRVLPLPPLVAGRISQLALTGIGLFVAVVWGRAAIRARGRMRAGLAMWSLAAAGWALGEVTWLAGGWHSGYAPIGTAGNAGFAVTMVATPLAAVLLVGRPSASLRTLFDALMIGTSLLFVVWALVLGPRQRTGDAHLGTVVYALVDVVILSLVLLLLAGGGAALRAPLEIAAVGIVVMFAADTVYAYQSVAGTYRFGSLPDLLWLTAFAIIAVAAPHRAELRGVTRLGESGRPRAYLPYVPFLLAFVTGLALLATHRQLDRMLTALSMTLTGLVVFRQMLILGDNRSLTRQLSALVEDLRFRAEHDPLTGLANRARFEESAERALEPAADRPVALLLLDLDGFKPVNDTYGHEAGDRVLVEVARRLRRAAGPDDVVARLGGDEFAVLTAGDPGPLAERVLGSFTAPFELGEAQARIGASVGVAGCRPGEHGVGQLVRDADVAMYEAKRGGRNSVA